MQIVTVNGHRYLVSSVEASDAGVTLNDTLEVESSARGVTRAEIGTYLQTKNLGNLGTQSVMGQASYGVEELTAEEQITLEHQEALFARAAEVALPQLVNQTYAGISNRG